MIVLTGQGRAFPLLGTCWRQFGLDSWGHPTGLPTIALTPSVQISTVKIVTSQYCYESFDLVDHALEELT